MKAVVVASHDEWGEGGEGPIAQGRSAIHHSLSQAVIHSFSRNTSMRLEEDRTYYASGTSGSGARRMQTKGSQNFNVNENESTKFTFI